MAETVRADVVRSLCAKLDQLELTRDEHRALSVILAAGIGAGTIDAEVEAFGLPVAPPVAVVGSAGFSSQFAATPATPGSEGLEVEFTFQRITYTWDSGGTSMSDSWAKP